MNFHWAAVACPRASSLPPSLPVLPTPNPVRQETFHAILGLVFHLLRDSVGTDDVTTTQALTWLCAVGLTPRDHKVCLDLGLPAFLAGQYALAGSSPHGASGGAGSG